MSARPDPSPGRLTSDPVPRLVRRLALPAATAMLFQTLFNITNSYWAGTWSTDALAALAIAFPIFFIVIAASFGFGQGSAALVAHALGGGRLADARRVWSHALLLAVLTGLAVAVLGVLGAGALARLLGAREGVLDASVQYIAPLLATAPLFLAAAVLNAALTASGDTRSLRNAVVTATFVNAGLVPLLMFGTAGVPGLGVSGIAAAHVVVQLGQLLWLWRKAARTPVGGGPILAEIGPDLAVLRRVVAQVLPNTLTMLTTGIGLAIVTMFVARHGAAAVAAYGVCLRIEQLVLLPTLGLNAATVALVGQNLGAGKLERVRSSIRTALGAAIVFMTIGAGLVYLVRTPMLGLFSDDPSVLELGTLYLAFAVAAFPAYAMVVIGAGVLQGLRRPLPALAVGVGRHVLAPPLVLWMLDVGLGLGFPGLALGVVGVACAGAIVTAALLARMVPRDAPGQTARC